MQFDNDHMQIERKFLHDMSNKLIIAQGMCSIVKRQLNVKRDGEAITKMDKTLKALDDSIILLRQHKEYLAGLEEGEELKT